MEAALRKGRVGSAGQGLSTRKGLCSRNWGLKAELTGQEDKIQNGFNSTATVVSRRYFHSWIHIVVITIMMTSGGMVFVPPTKRNRTASGKTNTFTPTRLPCRKMSIIHNNDVVFLVYKEA